MKKLILFALIAPTLMAQCVWKTIPNTRLRYPDCTIDGVGAFALNTGTPANNTIGGNLLFGRTETLSNIGTSSNFPFAFLTNNNERMRLSTTGGLSIGSSVLATDAGAGNILLSGTASAASGGTVPAWGKHSLIAIANGVNGCANANGCWQVNGILGANKAAGLTQDVVLAALPAKWHVTDWSVKTAVVCTGATTALSGLGVTSNNVLFRARSYDIAAAVSDTNLTTGPTAGAGANTAAGTNLIGSLITTVQNVDQLVVGCGVEYSVLWGVRP